MKLTISNSSTNNIKICYKDANTGLLTYIYVPAYALSMQVEIDEANKEEIERVIYSYPSLVIGKTTKEKMQSKNLSDENKRLTKVKELKDKEIKEKFKKYNVKQDMPQEQKEFFIVDEIKK